ncbi:MAG: DNA mismatch repair endonuclease MutL [Bacillota bacterium]|nr:DNA mismatch repair endonuclease MutL [Bacillota bacterium]
MNPNRKVPDKLMSIKVLDRSTSEQIAAGEVIENPSSVVKELIENALDAASSSIEIYIENGGKKIIRVTDNGCGIVKSELPVAFQRFATSKIEDITDLDNLSSLGFRGEALPSIAAVARVKLTSRIKESLSAWCITVEGGEITGSEETGAPIGTTVEVRDLFYNTPGRLKFLRADSVEAAKVSTLVSELALTHPGVSFLLNSGKKKLFTSTGDGNLKHAVASVYGIDTAEAMVEVNRIGHDHNIMVKGLTSAPGLNRSSRRWITLVINGRLIRNAMLVNAIERAYSDLLPRHRHPVAILHLRIPSKLIDVNVHPAKVEIRFQDPEPVKSLVYRSVRAALTEYSDLNLQKSALNTGLPHLVRESDVTIGKYTPENFLKQELKFDHYSTLQKTEAGNIDNNKESLFVENGPPGKSRLIGQFLHSYLLVQKDDKLLLIDQHAAHERILYHQVEKIEHSSDDSKASQLTIPQTLEIPVSWRDRMDYLLPFLSKTGFCIEPLGEYNYVIRAVPYMLHESFGVHELKDIIEKLLTDENESPDDYRDTIRKTIACHRSIKAKQPLSWSEMEKLLGEWEITPNAHRCPHGRPTVIAYDKAEIERNFLRRGN